ncbi:glycosyltransferase family 4 protein [Undibacterium sp. RuRC25W]|uniref:glycosyltransferase family 4 protein n=1 Tax=Undibacterium sp. RuRC25W TaxID=3413047 RepID=UPI003BF45CB1
MSTIYLNGKFLKQRTTGVQRFASGILFALDKSLSEVPSKTKLVLLTPHGVPFLELKNIEQRRCGGRRISLFLWEQVVLPFCSRDGLLINLSGSAPLFGGACLQTIHDAAIYDHYRAYSRLFVAWYRLLFYVVSLRAKLRMTVSYFSARELNLRIPGVKFKVLPNSAEHISLVPSDHNVLDRVAIKQKKFLLAVGSMNPTKNIERLIRAYSSLKLNEEISLVIVGSPNSRVFSGVDISESKIPGVLFTGPISDSELRSLYESALAFVFPSLYEGFGIPPLEAMVCRTPVIASNAASIPEVCGDAAYYFDPLDIEQMSSAIHRVISDSDLRLNLIKAGEHRCRQFSWSRSAELLRSYLSDSHFMV